MFFLLGNTTMHSNNISLVNVKIVQHEKNNEKKKYLIFQVIILHVGQLIHLNDDVCYECILLNHAPSHSYIYETLRHHFVT